MRVVLQMLGWSPPAVNAGRLGMHQSQQQPQTRLGGCIDWILYVRELSACVCRDAIETYLPAFEACVTEGHAQSVMCSYNAVNGFPTCASPDLLQKHLRQDWTFPGVVVSDCGAVEGVFRNHKFAK